MATPDLKASTRDSCSCSPPSISLPPAEEARQAPAEAAMSAAAGEEVESARCDCCGLTEDCTPAYVERVRGRHGGRWLCGLCAEAVQEEVHRAFPRRVTAEEALGRHVAFCRSFRSSPAPAAADANEHLIAAVRQLLRRSLDPSRAARSEPNTPRRGVATPRAALAPPGGFFSAMAGR